MEKLLKSFPQFLCGFMFCLSLSVFAGNPPPGFDSNPNDVWYYFNSVSEAEEYSKRVHNTCCVLGGGYTIYGKDGVRYNGGDIWKNGQDIGNVYVFGFRQTCPPNKWLNPDTGQCTSYSLGVPLIPPSPSCSVGNPTKAGNPIELGTGVKVQQEIDIPKTNNSPIFFERYYNASAASQYIWSHNYTKNITELNNTNSIPRTKALSAPFPTPSDACLSGWSAIKGNLTDSWAKNSTVEFRDGKCNVVRNNAVVNNLPIITNVDFVLTLDTPAVQLQRPAGEIYLFQYDSTQKYYGVNGALGNLIRVHSGDVEWRYTTANNDIEDYSVAGKLISTTSSNGVKQTLTYDSVSGLLSQVQDSVGGKLTFGYTGNTLTSVTENNNKITSYTYNASGNLITDVKRPDNTHRLYHYEDSRFPTYLTGITDERNVRYATWSYDAQGRAISSEHAGGAEKTLLAFNTDGSTTVTNALNKQTIYRFDDIAGARRVVKVEGQPTTNCVGANQNYSYTPEGWVASKTDWNGNKTTYAYNTKGQEISRIEAYGSPAAKTISSEWHPSLNLKTKITESDKETIYSYDANGLLVNQKTRSLVAQ